MIARHVFQPNWLVVNGSGSYSCAKMSTDSIRKKTYAFVEEAAWWVQYFVSVADKCGWGSFQLSETGMKLTEPDLKWL